jgi:hypothetical protein
MEELGMADTDSDLTGNALDVDWDSIGRAEDMVGFKCLLNWRYDQEGTRAKSQAPCRLPAIAYAVYWIYILGASSRQVLSFLFPSVAFLHPTLCCSVHRIHYLETMSDTLGQSGMQCSSSSISRPGQSHYKP